MHISARPEHAAGHLHAQRSAMLRSGECFACHQRFRGCACRLSDKFSATVSCDTPSMHQHAQSPDLVLAFATAQAFCAPHKGDAGFCIVRSRSRYDLQASRWHCATSMSLTDALLEHALLPPRPSVHLTSCMLSRSQDDHRISHQQRRPRCHQPALHRCIANDCIICAQAFSAPHNWGVEQAQR